VGNIAEKLTPKRRHVAKKSSFVLASDRYFTQKSLSQIIPGNNNKEILFIQETLYEFGYYKTEEDEPNFSSTYDLELSKSIKDFQKTNSLRETGRVDFATLQTLNDFLKLKYSQEKENPSTESDNKMKEIFTEKNYFENSGDAVDQYLNQTKQVQESEISIPKIIKKAVGSFVDLFRSTGSYRNSQRNFLEVTLPDKNRFENYNFFDCVSSDECLEFIGQQQKNKI
jgi:hypothetical protein